MPVEEFHTASALSLQIFAAWLYAGAAILKLRDIPRFQASLDAYRLIPEHLVPVAALGVIILEIVIAIALVPLQLIPAAYLLAYLGPLLFLIYAAAIAINLKRGRRSIDCGCGGMPLPLSRALVMRNVVLAALLSYALIQAPTTTLLNEQPALTIWLALLVASFFTVLCLVYSIFNQLLANRAIHQRLWLQIS